MKVVSLFSGCGGLDLGFKRSGFDIIWANDFDEDSVKTYKNNNLVEEINNIYKCRKIKI